MEILFTHLKPDVWQYKVASTLKKKGVKTVSVSLKSFGKKMFSRAFDEIICLELPNLKPETIALDFIKNPFKFIRFFSKIIKIKADAAIIQGPPLYLTSFFLWLFKGRFPRIFFSYDVLSAIYRDVKSIMPKREIWGEKYSFKNCDAILDKNSIKELDLLPKSFEVDKKPIIQFCGYPLTEWFVPYVPKKKLSYADKEIHIVYVGFVMGGLLLKFFSDIREVLKQKIHMHIYPNDKLTEKDILKITRNENELKFYLHIHDFVAPDKLSSEISKYDFGFIFVDFLKVANPKAIRYTFGNKRSAYFEAMLPVIAKTNSLFFSYPVKKYYLGICIMNIKNLRKAIEKFEYERSIKKIEKYREKTSVENNIDRLIKFVKMLKKQHA